MFWGTLASTTAQRLEVPLRRKNWRISAKRALNEQDDTGKRNAQTSSCLERGITLQDQGTDLGG
jgi:hypothetical protein